MCPNLPSISLLRDSSNDSAFEEETLEGERNGEGLGSEEFDASMILASSISEMEKVPSPRKA